MARKNGGSTGDRRGVGSENTGSTPLGATVIREAGTPYSATISSRVNAETDTMARDRRMLAGMDRLMYSRS